MLVYIGQARQLVTGGFIDEGREAEPVPEFMLEHSYQVDVCAVVVVETQVPEGPGKASGVAQIGVEAGANVFTAVGRNQLRRSLICAGNLVGKRIVIPGVRNRCIGEIRLDE